MRSPRHEEHRLPDHEGDLRPGSPRRAVHRAAWAAATPARSAATSTSTCPASSEVRRLRLRRQHLHAAGAARASSRASPDGLHRTNLHRGQRGRQAPGRRLRGLVQLRSASATFKWAYDNGFIKANLPKAEYDVHPLGQVREGRPRVPLRLLQAHRLQAGRIRQRPWVWMAPGSPSAGRSAPSTSTTREVAYWKMGHPKHHSSENGGPGWEPWSTSSTTAMRRSTPTPTSRATACRSRSRSRSRPSCSGPAGSRWMTTTTTLP